MPTKDEEFLEKLRAAFAIEAEEHLQTMSEGLLALEKIADGPPQTPLIESVFREAHSLKGAARAVNAAQIEALCQPLESLFSAWKKGAISASPPLFALIYQALDLTAKLLNAPDTLMSAQISDLAQQLERLAKGETSAVKRGASGNGKSAPIQNLAIETKIEQLAPPEAKNPVPPSQNGPQGPANNEPSPPQNPPPHAPLPDTPEKTAIAETVRISTAKLDALLLEAEEMLTVKLTASQRAADLRDLATNLTDWQKEWAKISEEARHLRQSVAQNSDLNAVPIRKLLDFLDWNGDALKTLQNRLAILTRTAEQDRRALGSRVDSLLEDAKKLLMLPFSTLLGGFPKLVRDISRDQNKDVQLVLRGGEVEMDKRILEEIKDPLVHLLRNAVDHGIETPAERVRGSKSARATVTVAISQKSGNEAEILVQDDGGGIPLEKVKQSAVAHGHLSAEAAAALDETTALNLIFQSEVSTSPILTEISGRGLGMAIVREKIEKLGGHIEVETTSGVGTTFRIALPLTLATFTGLLVEENGQTFVLPVAAIERVVRVKNDDIQTVENRETVCLPGISGAEVVSLVHLGDVLEMSAVQAKRETNFPSLVVMGSGEGRIAFRVEAILHEQEVLVKKLGTPLQRVRNVAGATVLGSGQVVPILNPVDLLKSAVRAGITAPSQASPDAEKAEGASILVVEDSITSRMLLKNILEGSGYRVATAVDGVDALTTLRAQDFDLVVSDIDMPRLNGLDLTLKIREDKRLAEMPVILVTARGTPEDRERGIEVGANAYLVKSNFDQSNLLDAIGRFV